ncbi:MAG: hypothetical protein QOH46_2583 [Solirubrobacteraceae bacterium]|jgi:aspartate 1-decarboxylase|nr:hypothetical protein [Solirubrobacteraceae bacterium]
MFEPEIHRGETISVIPHAQYDEAGLAGHAPRVVHVETGSNAITSAGDAAAAAIAG